ncbi:phosphatase PAP2 family protein [Fulvivirgaceae bacterium LMO-SS25]
MDRLIEKLAELDQQLFLFLNGINSPIWDTIFHTISGKLIWVPLYLFLAYKLWQLYGTRVFIYVALLLGLMITLSDFVASGIFKPFFERLRPCYEPSLEGLVHNPFGCGGRYGFVSSHASNSFAVAGFLWLAFRKLNAKYGYLFIWALVVAYSRVYLGVHYPADILVGGIIGLLSALFVYWLLTLIMQKLVKKK